MVTERDSASGKVKDLELQVEELEAKERQHEGVVLSLKARVSELEAEVKSVGEKRGNIDSDSRARIAELEAELKLTKEAKRKSNLKAAETAIMALEMAGEDFQKALAQIALIHPSLPRDESILHVDHDVEGGRIVKEDPVSKKCIVIYPPPSNV